LRVSWPREQVNEQLESLMEGIHLRCAEHGRENGWINYVQGANIAGFVKVADAMLAYGAV